MAAPTPEVEPGAPVVPPWHVLRAGAVLDLLDAAGDGLTSGQAAERLAHHGPNRLDVVEATPWWRVLARQFVSPLIGILVLALAVTLAMREWVDAGAIGFVLVLNAGIGYWQERKAESAVRALRELATPYCRAVRDGVEQTLPAADLVPGDVVLLESGERVPADLRLLEARGLHLDESMLTGESLPVAKTADELPPGTPVTERVNLAFSGTLVTSGRARGAVIGTGAETELGAVNALVQGPAGRSPLQEITASLERRIGFVVAVASTFVLVAGLVLGNGLSEMFRTAVALAVASVPESMPIVLTVAMSLGVARMARRSAIVRSLPAVETLGSTTLIGSDKTGTLTLNRMTVERVWTAAGGTVTAGAASTGTGPVADCLRTGALTNEAVSAPDDPLVMTGDAVDVAMARVALEQGLVDPVERGAAPLAMTPYEPALRLSQAVRRDARGRRVLHVKGSPDVLAAKSTTLADGAGGRPMDAELVATATEELAASGMRVIATAGRFLAEDEVLPAHLPPPSGLTFLGLEGMEDPPRPGVAEAVADCQRAGIRVMMITGDHPATAASIAGRLGLEVADPPVTGAEVAEADDDALLARLRRTGVAARVTPRDKLRIVRVLQESGEVVAVTGDGVNDAPALRAASIGVAMGRSGTEVAREAADVVLTDDDFVTVVEAIRQGRVTFSAIRNATFFLLASGLASLSAVAVNVLAEGPLLFLPVQLLFINVVTNGLQDIAMAFEPPEGNELRRPPRPRSEGLLSRTLWLRTALVGAWLAIALLVTFQWALARGYDVEHARALTATMFVVMNFYVLGTARSETRSVLVMNPFSNRLLITCGVAALLVHLGVMSWSPTATLIGYTPLSAAEWVACVVLGASVLVVVEADKAYRWWSRRRERGVGAGRTGAPAPDPRP